MHHALLWLFVKKNLWWEQLVPSSWASTGQCPVTDGPCAHAPCGQPQLHAGRSRLFLGSAYAIQPRCWWSLRKTPCSGPLRPLVHHSGRAFHQILSSFCFVWTWRVEGVGELPSLLSLLPNDVFLLEKMSLFENPNSLSGTVWETENMEKKIIC